MRRILRKIAANDYAELGDTSTLTDPGVVTDLVENLPEPLTGFRRSVTEKVLLALQFIGPADGVEPVAGAKLAAKAFDVMFHRYFA